MDFFQAVILGIVEGVTEFLPVSSTGHMIVASHFLRIPQTEFLKTFEIAIQLGAIASVFSLYWRVFVLDWEVGLKVLTAFVPTAIIGFVVYKAVKQFLMGNMVVVASAFILGGIFLIVFELLYRGRHTAGGRGGKGAPQGNCPTASLESISYPQAFMIGICQALAVVPGVSRSAATIVGGLMMGISRTTIVEFSFLLAVPTMLAATALDLLKSSSAITAAEFGLLAVGFVVAFVVAFAAVKLLLRYIKQNDFIPFGIYRIVAGVIILLFLRHL